AASAASSSDVYRQDGLRAIQIAIALTTTEPNISWITDSEKTRVERAKAAIEAQLSRAPASLSAEEQTITVPNEVARQKVVIEGVQFAVEGRRNNLKGSLADTLAAAVST